MTILEVYAREASDKLKLDPRLKHHGDDKIKLDE